MKLIVISLATVVFIPVFIILLISGSVKFLLLDDSFWIINFNKFDTYKSIQNEVIKFVESKNVQTIRELITEENVKDFTNRNITKVLLFLNGKTNELSFYVPIQKIPEGMLPKRLGSFSEDMSIGTVIEKFNISSLDAGFVNKFSNTGKYVDYIFYISLIILILISIYASPYVFALIGILLMIQKLLVNRINLNTNPLIEIIAMPLIQSVSFVWLYIGITLLLISIFIFWFKRIKITKDGQI